MQSFFLGPVTPSDVSDSAKKLKSKLSSGHDNISTKLMKDTLNYIIEPITHIINQSLCTGIVPTDMKIAKVVPIYKSADSTILNESDSTILNESRHFLNYWKKLYSNN